MSVIILHINTSNCDNKTGDEKIMNMELLMCLSSKYLEYVPIGGNIKFIKDTNQKYLEILKNGLRETKEETMKCICDRYIKVLAEDEKCIKYLCKNHLNEYTEYILFKEQYQIPFSTKQKSFYIILHFINDIEIIKSIKKLKEIRSYTIDTIKLNNKDKILNLPQNMNTKYNTIEKINEMYIFEKKENSQDKKLYISSYLESIELKWIPFDYLINNYQINTDRLYDNKFIYNTIFYKSWNILYTNIINKKINENWLFNYLDGKNIENKLIINHHYQSLLIQFIKNNKNYFEN